MRTFFRLLSYVLLLPLIVWIIWVNARLYHQPRYKLVEGQSIHAGLQAQLAWLTEETRPAALAARALSPEDQLRTLALYGLAACDLMQATPPSAREHAQARAQVDSALVRLSRLAQRGDLPTGLSLPGGASYHGWVSYLRGRKLALQPTNQRSSQEMAAFQTACDQVVSAWRQLGHPYPARLSETAYAVDGVLCAAALGQHEQIQPGRYTSALATWIQQIEARIDESGLLPSRVAVASGEHQSVAEGHDLGLMLVLLADLAPGLAQEQYSLYRQRYLTSVLGIPALRQVPSGSEPGPIPDPQAGRQWGSVGTIASLVGIRALSRMGAEGEAVGLRNAIEALALGINWQGEKRYLFDQWLPFEAWAAWSKGLEAKASQRMIATTPWQRTFQLVSAGVGITLIALLIFLHWATRAPSSPAARSEPSEPTAHMLQRRPSPDPPEWELPHQA
jgi:hypothetical protein